MDPPIEPIKQQGGASESGDSEEDAGHIAEADRDIENEAAQGIEPTSDNHAKSPSEDRLSVAPIVARLQSLAKLIDELEGIDPTSSEKQPPGDVWREAASLSVQLMEAQRHGYSSEALMGRARELIAQVTSRAQAEHLAVGGAGPSVAGELGAETETLKVNLPPQDGQSIFNDRREEGKDLSQEVAEKRIGDSEWSRGATLDWLQAESHPPATELPEDAATRNGAYPPGPSQGYGQHSPQPYPGQYQSPPPQQQDYSSPPPQDQSQYAYPPEPGPRPPPPYNPPADKPPLPSGWTPCWDEHYQRWYCKSSHNQWSLLHS